MLNKYSYKILEWISTPGKGGSPEELKKLGSWCVILACIEDLADKGLIKHTDVMYDLSDNRKPVPADTWFITQKGLNYLQEEKTESFWRIVPLAISSALSVAAIIISIIALLKP